MWGVCIKCQGLLCNFNMYAAKGTIEVLMMVHGAVSWWMLFGMWCMICSHHRATGTPIVQVLGIPRRRPRRSWLSRSSRGLHVHGGAGSSRKHKQVPQHCVADPKECSMRIVSHVCRPTIV